VAPGVKADLETCGSKPGKIARGKPSTWQLNEHAHFRGNRVELDAGEALDELRCLVNGVRDPAGDGREVEFRERPKPKWYRITAVSECLQILPPEAVRCVQRCAADEECGGKACTLQRWTDDVNVRPQIVVESDGDRKAVTCATTASPAFLAERRSSLAATCRPTRRLIS
jgi:hypothetical protein